MDLRRKWFVEPLVLRLFLFVSVLVLGILVPAGYLVARQYFASSLDLKRNETYLQDHVIAIALEHQMLEGRRDLIAKMIDGFSSDPGVKRLMILDHEGRVRLTNDETFTGRVFTTDSPACQVCHALPSRERATSAVIDLEGGAVLRSVYPLRNRAACHSCHDPAITVNGVMITDTDITDLRDRLEAQLQVTGVVVVVIALALLAGITGVVRLLVLRPLERVESTTRAMSKGDFSRRVAVQGTGAIARLVGEFNDMADSVTDLLAQLRRHRTQLENVMSSVDDGLLVIDRTFSVVAVNKSLAERIGTTRENLLYRRCAEIWTPPCNGHGHAGGDGGCPAQACFASGQLHKSLRTVYGADGTVREEEVFASPIVDGNGEVDQVVEVWRDITERKSREARMAEFQRLVSLGMLASGFSHEVNTPLGTMLVHVDEVRRRADAEGSAARLDDVRGELDVIRGEILRCRDLTQQFLQLSRGQSILCELVDLPAIVRGTLPLVERLAAGAGVQLRVIENRDSPVALANGGAVRQVLLNILLNAVQASRRGAEVRVGWHGNGTTSIRIEDDGVGMTPEVREKAFEPFFSQRPAGTGLGLFVSLNLARQWGGDIRVTSTLGRGSVFEVLFPSAEDPCRPPISSSSTTTTTSAPH